MHHKKTVSEQFSYSTHFLPDLVFIGFSLMYTQALIISRHLTHDYVQIKYMRFLKNLLVPRFKPACLVLCQMHLYLVHCNHFLSNPRGPFQVADTLG